MKVIATDLPEVKIVEPQVFGDNRGWFYESYSYEKLRNEGIDVKFIQDNRSYSKEKGTLRGIHFQKSPMAQSKLITCTRGKILDVAVDLRKDSPDYLRWVSVELSEENKLMLFIPKGFGHGFLTLSEDVEVLYKVDEYYSKEHDRSIRFDDKTIGINWGIDDPVLSEKDRNAPPLCDSDVDF
ncbi:MAG: dTDP-4-dehydrorhamnose 3,5-epimerase [Ruminococcaceae bacterium]|nr:dTDP-4-dehydrorhamnose 3,5-epimerase [Oscillospiraceae bacterium]